MSKGFLVLAQNTNDYSYVDQAYALALSIKLSQKEHSISLVTNDPVPERYKKVFDKIIEIPWIDGRASTRYRTENRWKLYHVTPYDETIVVDSDMLFLEDISQWWKYCENYDLKFCSKIKNYKLEYITDTVFRKAFISNNLTNPYFALHYFKKSDQAHDFYKVLEFVCNNWEWCWTKFAPVEYQKWPSMDLATAVAIEIFGNHEQLVDVNCPLEFIHMKSAIQGWPILSESWQDVIPHILTSNGELVVGNIKQTKIFHYIEKNFINDSMIKKLEGIVYG